MTPEDILKKYWQYDSFRPMQRDIIQSVLEGRDTLALLPTGGGKSICFQVPALCTEGVCLVISPLIALMKDQVENLKKRGIAAAAIFSGMHYRDIDRLFDNAVYGGLKFLYISPERLTTDLAKERIKRMNVNLLAIDEAHCISQWGYDFRPPYLEIAAIREFMPDTPVLALTATATPDVVTDICKKLEFRKDHQVFQQNFERKNLSYIVRHVEAKEQKLLEILKKTNGSSVVYVRNRKSTKVIAEWLQKLGFKANFYHAGLPPEERNHRQDDWISGKTSIIVATNAFGMGIDKPDVRAVVHYDLPDSLEAYFQEAGRAGRDGKRSYAVLLVNKADTHNLTQYFETSFPEMKDIRRTYDALGSYLQLAVGGGEGQSFDFDIVDFAQRYQFDLLKTYSSFKVLEQDGWLAYTEGVHQPSNFKFLVNREQLYDFQIRKRELEYVIKGLLRAVAGALTDYATFNELQVAQFLRMPVSDLERILNYLHNENIIDYRPRKDKPQMVFVRERTDNQYLSIDWNLYMFRKKRAEFRLKKSIEYVELDICRSKQLLQYFGQVDADKCGVCDVCLEKDKDDLETNDFVTFSEKIKALVKREPLSLKDIVDSFAERQRTKVIQTIGFMLDEGSLQKKGDKFTV
ncbi:MAG: RecQ family ATP-dependent DNA helicase [Saprospiraceae bacterium]|nr:RecQ family ATP-dependent DNA helicase [Saprospiraceae bacterium]